jgi:hypothetical protein
VYDPRVTEQHFIGAEWRGGWLTYDNGSRVKVLRGHVSFRDLMGISLDVAVVLTPIEGEALYEVRARLFRQGGTLFAPFAIEEPARSRTA